MRPLFDERERAAENIYVHDEELRFLAHRRGLETLAGWAADSMSMTPEDKAVYVADTVDAFVNGLPETTLAEQIQTHLERAGKPALSVNVGAVLTQAVAEATEALRHGPPPEPTMPSVSPRPALKRPGRTFGWSL